MGCSSSDAVDEPKKDKKEKKEKESGDESDKKSDKKKDSSSSSSSDEDSSHSERGSPRSVESDNNEDSDKEVPKKKKKKKEKKEEEEEKPEEEPEQPEEKPEEEPPQEPEEKPEEEPVQEPVEEPEVPLKVPDPFVIGRYECHKKTNSWKVRNPHAEYRNVFKSHEISGDNDWAHGHNRLTSPGGSSITVTFHAPVDAIREAYPDCTMFVKVGMFAPWNMDPCSVTLSVNGESKKVDAPVKGEHKGRTHLCGSLNDIADEECTVTLDFNSGSGVLFLWYFEIKVKPTLAV